MQSLIRTAEQLKIKGLCEINEHTNADSDTEFVNYPPNKKLRTSKKFEYSRNNFEHIASRPGTSKETALNLTDKNVPPIVLLDNNNKPKESSKSNNNNNNNGSKNMASLEMGMVGMVMVIRNNFD